MNIHYCPAVPLNRQWCLASKGRCMVNDEHLERPFFQSSLFVSNPAPLCHLYSLLWCAFQMGKSIHCPWDIPFLGHRKAPRTVSFFPFLLLAQGLFRILCHGIVTFLWIWFNFDLFRARSRNEIFYCFSAHSDVLLFSRWHQQINDERKGMLCSPKSVSDLQLIQPFIISFGLPTTARNWIMLNLSPAKHQQRPCLFLVL